MATPNIFVQPAMCLGCRWRTFGSFAATALDLDPIAASSAPRRLLRPAGRRYFAETAAKPTAVTGAIEDGVSRNPGAPIRESTSTSPLSATPSSSSSDTNIPWYLQVETPKPPTLASDHPLADRYLLPDLPANPPPILSPTLSYLSVEAGLDNLDLLDLRSLDPPPALGGNLLMILGTARSVKHLNVTADRFCRWLRSQYKLRPYADGLLGRNELKLKLRRKARKARLAASVGNTMAADRAGVDDGITTRWICVNVGQVDAPDGEDGAKDADHDTTNGEKLEVSSTTSQQDAPEERSRHDESVDNESLTREAEEGEDEEEIKHKNDGAENLGYNHDEVYAGFGLRSTAPRIVVQIFTEEKRAEVDLEGLWQDRATRRTRKTT